MNHMAIWGIVLDYINTNVFLSTPTRQGNPRGQEEAWKGLRNLIANVRMRGCGGGAWSYLLYFCWLVGLLCFTSHRQRGHLETAPPFTVPCGGCEARFLHRLNRETNPGPSCGSPLHSPKYLTLYSLAILIVIRHSE